jgi:ribonuclease HI
MQEMSARLEFRCTNNQAEYEALIVGLQVLMEMHVQDVEAFGD